MTLKSMNLSLALLVVHATMNLRSMAGDPATSMIVNVKVAGRSEA